MNQEIDRIVELLQAAVRMCELVKTDDASSAAECARRAADVVAECNAIGGRLGPLTPHQREDWDMRVRPLSRRLMGEQQRLKEIILRALDGAT